MHVVLTDVYLALRLNKNITRRANANNLFQPYLSRTGPFDRPVHGRKNVFKHARTLAIMESILRCFPVPQRSLYARYLPSRLFRNNKLIVLSCLTRVRHASASSRTFFVLAVDRA